MRVISYIKTNILMVDIAYMMIKTASWDWSTDHRPSRPEYKPTFRHLTLCIPIHRVNGRYRRGDKPSTYRTSRGGNMDPKVLICSRCCVHTKEPLSSRENCLSEYEYYPWFLFYFLRSRNRASTSNVVYSVACEIFHLRELPRCMYFGALHEWVRTIVISSNNTTLTR